MQLTIKQLKLLTTIKTYLINEFINLALPDTLFTVIHDSDCFFTSVCFVSFLLTRVKK